MKKALLVSAVAVSCVLTAGVLASCGQPAGPVEKTGEAWALVHGAGYVGYASVTTTDGKITAASLNEACFPTYVTAEESAATEDEKVTVTVMSHGSEVEKTYYKTVKFAGLTLTYDTEKKDYLINGSTAWAEWCKTEANCKTYYNAVVANQVAVVINGKDDLTVLNAASLLKTQNGYGGTRFDWAGNANATTKYVIDNGFANIAKLALTEGQKAFNDKDAAFFDGTVNSGATWVDMVTTKDTYVGYVNLLQNAYNAIK